MLDLSGNLADYVEAPETIIIIFCTGDYLKFDSIGFKVEYKDGELYKITMGNIVKGACPLYLNVKDITAIVKEK